MKERIEYEESMMGETDEIEIAPPAIASDKTALKYYGALVSVLDSKNLIDNADRFMVGEFADCLSKIEACNKEINQSGLTITIETKGGAKTVPNPAVAIHKTYVGLFKKFCSDFGFGPSARASLSSLANDMKNKEEDSIVGAIKSLKQEENGG